MATKRPTEGEESLPVTAEHTIGVMEIAPEGKTAIATGLEMIARWELDNSKPGGTYRIPQTDGTIIMVTVAYSARVSDALTDWLTRTHPYVLQQFKERQS